MKGFLDKGNVMAVVGATVNREKYGYKVYEVIRIKGYEVYPVNPKYEEIEGRKCFSSLADIPRTPDVVITIVPPEVTEKIVKQARELGIAMIWMQPGSESEAAVQYCLEKGMKVVYNKCIVVDGLGASFSDLELH